MRILVALFLVLAFSLDARPPRHYRQYPVGPMRTITEFQTPLGVLSGAGGTSTASTGIVFTGTQSNRLTVGASTVNFIGSISPAVNICSDSFVVIALYFANKSNIVNASSLSLVLGNNVTNYFAYSIQGSINDTLLGRKGAWGYYGFDLRKFSRTGTPNCALIDSVVIAAAAVAATQDTIYLGGVYTYPPRIHKARMAISCDDNYNSCWTYLDRKMDSVNGRWTAFVNVDRFGIAGCISVQAMMDLYRSGGRFDIGNHLSTHDTAGLRSVDSAYKLVKGGYDFIRGLGVKGPSIVATPYGSKSYAMDSMMRVSGFVDLVRGTANLTDGEPQYYWDPYSARSWILFSNTLTLAAAKAALDTLIANNGIGIGVMHEIVTDASTGSTKWAQSDWSAFMDYAAAKVALGLLEIVSVGDLMELTGGVGPMRRMGKGY